ncbi:hypothetical protein BOX15_Mlig017224g2 [Macrostomum lignano]|uniref:CBM21 domain-containing protein n=1 Tax=Macrostomum lignano TaxID=282301 RepID=A0A267DU46_9PLAT|nr:hypothetical protein BOX15_Mlig017224g2 [Macrostomum lignano]
MCQFKVVNQQQQAAGGCQCRCGQQLEAPPASTTTDELRQLPVEILARYVSVRRPLEACHRTVSDTTSAYSPALAAQLTASGEPGCANGRRHRVRFADDMGRSLIEIRLYQPDPPTCFDNELEDKQQDSDWQTELDDSYQDAPRLVCDFELLSREQVLASLTTDGIRLEKLGLNLRTSCIVGRAVVTNLVYQKRVFVRVTLDAWRTYVDVDATFAGSIDNRLDAFAFRLPLSAAEGLDLANEPAEFEFCLGFESGLEPADRRCLWDSNGGRNYRASLLPPPRRATFCIDSDEE